MNRTDRISKGRSRTFLVTTDHCAKPMEMRQNMRNRLGRRVACDVWTLAGIGGIMRWFGVDVVETIRP